MMVHKVRKEMSKRLMAIILCFLCLAGLLPWAPVVQAQNSPAKVYSVSEIEKVIEGIINWKKVDNGSTPEGYLINDTFLASAGTSADDWFPLSLDRYSYPDNYEGYLAMLTEAVQNRYKGPDKLSAVKATEWHRIALAVLAMGGDPTAVGKDPDGKPINLIADGTYDRGKTVSLGKQGINGWIWGLITLDSQRYEIPAGAAYSRSDIITEILRQQLIDGGFALTGSKSDPDITAMALQALAPYYESTQTYTYQRVVTGQTATRSVREVVDEALAWLSTAQQPGGDYKSWGSNNLESTAQVVVALCSLGIDPQKDQRFIKNGVSILDGMLSYRWTDGGFIHSRTYDADNPTSKPDKTNSMASEQALYSFVAVWRQMKGLSPLYDFRAAGNKVAAPEQGNEVPAAKPGNEAPAAKQGDEASAAGHEDKAPATEHKLEFVFSDADRAEVKNLPAKLTTEQYVQVVGLLDKLEKSGDFPDKSDCAARLTAAKQEILGIQARIDAINQDVLAKLYPFDRISLSERSVVNDIVNRYEALSDYDKGKVLHWEDVVKTKTKLDNLVRALGIASVLAVAGIVTAISIVRRLRRRSGKKAREMEELAASYGENDSQ